MWFKVEIVVADGNGFDCDNENEGIGCDSVDEEVACD
jgi:hypothetical protein